VKWNNQVKSTKVKLVAASEEFDQSYLKEVRLYKVKFDKVLSSQMIFKILNPKFYSAGEWGIWNSHSYYLIY